MFRRKIRILLIVTLAVCGSQAVALPVHVSFDWPNGKPASASSVHIEAVQTVGPNAIAAPVEAESRPDRLVLDLGNGVWHVQALAPGYWSQGVDVEITSSTPVDVRLALWPAASLRGEVVTAAGETLPETVEVRLNGVRSLPEESRSRDAFAPAGPSPSRGELHCRIHAGSWSCLGPAGVFDVRLEAFGYAPRYQWGVNLKAGESTDFGRTELLRTTSVFGRVLRKDGSNPPMPCRATLSLDIARRGPVDADEDPQETASGKTALPVSINQRGFFQLVGVAPGRYALAVACHDASGFRELRVRGDSETRIDPPLRLEELTLNVSVSPKTDPAGRPWKLTLYSTAPHYLLITDGATTAADGRWVRHGLMAGNYHIVVRSSNGTEWLQKYFDFGKTTAPLTLYLGSVSVAGRVIMSSQPVRARLVFTNDSGGESATLTSDQSGRFQGLLPSAQASNESIWTVEAHLVQPPVTQRLLGVRVPASANSATWLDLELPAVPVHGSVVSPDNKPQRNVQVTFENSSRIRHTISTDAAGRFEMLDLPPGKYTAVADSSDGSSDRIPFEVTERCGKELKLVLNPFKRYSFSVVSSQGPVEAAAVQVWIKPGVTWAFLRTDENGQFQVSLPPGITEVGLTIGAPGYAIKLVRLSIPSDEDTSSGTSTITLDDSGGTLVLNFRPPGQALDNSDTVYLVHNGAIQDARTIAGWATSQIATSTDEPAVINAIEPGTYSLCMVAVPVQLAALWSGSLPSINCRTGSVEQGETLTLALR